MALDKAIKSGKEHRNPRRSFDPSCNSHKRCPACESNRKYSSKKALDRAKSIEKEPV